MIARLRLPIFYLLLFFLAIPESPAPIQENPEPMRTPKPEREHVSSRTSHERPAAKSTPEKAVSFAGTWGGTASGPSKQALIGTITLSSNYTLKVSPDERHVNWTSSAWMFSHFQATAQKSGRTLNWTCERHDIAGQTNIALKLEMNADGTGHLDGIQRYDKWHVQRLQLPTYRETC